MPILIGFLNLKKQNKKLFKPVPGKEVTILAMKKKKSKKSKKKKKEKKKKAQFMSTGEG